MFAVASHRDRLHNHDEERQAHRELEKQVVARYREGAVESLNGGGFIHGHLPGTFGPCGVLSFRLDESIGRNITIGCGG